jgi:hypothetical protein
MATVNFEFQDCEIIGINASSIRAGRYGKSETGIRTISGEALALRLEVWLTKISLEIETQMRGGASSPGTETVALHL